MERAVAMAKELLENAEQDLLSTGREEGPSEEKRRDLGRGSLPYSVPGFVSERENREKN